MGNGASKVSTRNAKQSPDKKQRIKIEVRMDCIDLPDNYDGGSRYNLGVIEVVALYSPKESIKDILLCVLQHLRTKHYPIQFEIGEFGDESFIFGLTKNVEENISDIQISEETINTPITIWKKESIDILALHVYIHYVHKIESNNITCCYMKKAASTDPLKCPIYDKMLTSYEWNANNLKHITEFEHFQCEFSEKKECKFNDDCYAYKRLEKGGNDMKDLCHMKLFRHPPRKRQIALQENVHSFVVQTKKDQKYQKVYEPTKDDEKQYDYNETNGYLNALLEEVVSNGFMFK